MAVHNLQVFTTKEKPRATDCLYIEKILIQLTFFFLNFRLWKFWEIVLRELKYSVSQILFNNFCAVSLKKKPHSTAKNQLLKETPDFISFLLLTDHAIYFQRVHQFVVFFSRMFPQASYNLPQVKWQVLPRLSVPCRTDRRDCSWSVIALHSRCTSSSSGLASDLRSSCLSFWRLRATELYPLACLLHSSPLTTLSLNSSWCTYWTVRSSAAHVTPE